MNNYDRLLLSFLLFLVTRSYLSFLFVIMLLLLLFQVQKQILFQGMLTKKTNLLQQLQNSRNVPLDYRTLLFLYNLYL